MIPPFAPYIPMKHPDDWLPIQSPRRALPIPDAWVEWLAEDAQPQSDTQTHSAMGKILNWVEALRFRRRTRMPIIEEEIRC